MIENNQIYGQGGTFIATGANSAGKVEADILPVMKEYGGLGNQISNLTEALSELEFRLAPVLSPERADPINSEPASTPRESLSPLAESLRGEADRISGLIRRINYLRNRLEIN